jgi:hypothetical protein
VWVVCLVKKTVLLSCICILILVLLAATPVPAAMITCPSSTCSCLLPAEAQKAGSTEFCSGKQQVCGTDSQNNQKYCYKKPATTVVPHLIVTGYTLVSPTATTTTAPPPGIPDLIINDVYTDAWPSFREFRYIIQNRGTGAAGPGTTRLFIDGVQVGEDPVATLNPGESRVRTFTVSGTCTGSSDLLGAVADSTGAVTESDETNNARQREYTCPAVTTVPDLALLDIWHDGERNFTYGTRAYTPVENIRFHMRSRNTTGALTTEARLFIDGTWVSTTTATAATTRDSGWEGQFGYTGICSGTSDTVRVVIDPANTLIEQDETNNELTVTWNCSVMPASGQRPDLVIRRYWTSYMVDYSRKIGYEILNQGKEYSPFTETGMFIDGVYHIQDGVDPLAPGESRNEEFWQNYSYRECSGTSDTIRLVADHDARVTETDETNNNDEFTMNCTDIPAPVSPRADLVIPSAWYECPIPCHAYTIRYSIHNQGSVMAGGSSTSLTINGRELDRSPVPHLDPGDYSTLAFSNTWIPDSRDNHISVCADAGDSVNENAPERNGELNNCFETDWEIAPSCHDGTRNGAEEGVDCGGSCTPCNMVLIAGRILFEDTEWENSADGMGASRGAFPARRIKFLLMDDAGDITSLKTTNNDGTFYLTIPSDYRGKSLRIRIGDCSNFKSGFNYAAKIARDYDGCNEYVKWTSNPFTVPETGDLYLGDRTINATTDTDFQFDIEHKGYDATYPCYTLTPCDDEQVSRDGGSAYFSIADAALAGREYADENRGGTDSIGKPSIQYPDEEWNMFYPPTYIIDIAGYKAPDSDYPHGDDAGWPDMGFNDGGVLHEYGHYLAYKISYLNPFGGTHSTCDHKVPEFAWNEGWADYYGTIVIHRDQVFGSYTTGSLTEPDYGFDEIENKTCGASEGDHYEGHVAAILWDLADDPATFHGSVPETWDTIRRNEYLTFRVFDNQFGGATGHAYVPTICTFVERGWEDDDFDAVRVGDVDEIHPLLTHMSVEC